MDDNKSKQERLFLQARELCKNNIEDEVRLTGATALDMSQYSILGDEVYNLDYIPKIDISGVMWYKQYTKYKQHTDDLNTNINVGVEFLNGLSPTAIDDRSSNKLSYIDELSQRFYDSKIGYTKELSLGEYVLVLRHNLDVRLMGVIENDLISRYNKSLPVQSKFIYIIDDVYLIVNRGRLSIIDLKQFISPYPRDFHTSTVYPDEFGYISIVQYIKWLKIQNLKLLRKKIKVKRNKKK